MLRGAWLGLGVAAIVTAAACSAGKKTVFNGSNGSAPSAGAGAANGTSTAMGGGSSVSLNVGAGPGGSTASGVMCDAQPTEDKDKDGFTFADGDCNDCDPNVNPNAVEVPCDPQMMGCTPSDQDCDGKAGNVPAPCDASLNIASNDPMDGAKAMGLCTKSAGKFANGVVKWGVTSAQWTALDLSQANVSDPNYALGHGILSAFGPNVKVQEGKKMLGLSSGSARQPSDPGYQDVGGFDKGYFAFNYPKGNFPKESPACPGTVTGEPHDYVSLVVKIRTPSNAHGFKFNFNFYTYEWPDWVCTTYNDFFVTMLTPVPMGLADGNIVFDKQKNPVTVNNAFVEVCGCLGGPPCSAGGKNFTCALGDKTLTGTGFGLDTAGDDHASTMWLQTQAPVDPSSDVTVQFAVWDSGDGVLDTTALIDNWQWIAKPGTGISTDPVPNPK